MEIGNSLHDISSDPSAMADETPVVIDFNKQEKLVPVLTYVNGLSHEKAVSAWLNFLCVCHTDYTNNIRMPHGLSPDDEALCVPLLDICIKNYAEIKPWTPQQRLSLISFVYKYVRGSSGENRLFLHDRLRAICGERVRQKFWGIYEEASGFEEIAHAMEESLSTLQAKNMADFSIFLIALLCFYGASNDFRGRIAAVEEKLKTKYRSPFPVERLGLYLWPLDFSFVQEETPPTLFSEHHALLTAVRSINPDVRVRACVDSLLWSRDMIAWLDNDYGSYARNAGEGPRNDAQRNFSSEGGSIVMGRAVDNFVFVAKGAFSDPFSEVAFYGELDKRNIKAYSLPDGFIWARNPETGADKILGFHSYRLRDQHRSFRLDH